MKGKSEEVLCRRFFRGCLNGLGIALVIYAITYTGFSVSGTKDLVPGAYHTVCMIIFVFGYIPSNGMMGCLKDKLAHATAQR